MNVVVVDDDPFNLDLISAVLEPLERRVIGFGDPRDALAALPALQTSLVITDHLMPEIDGVELIRRLRAEPGLADVPVLMLTGADELAVRVAAFEVGATDFATRPIDPTELLARARALSRLGQAQGELKRQAALLAGEVRVATASLAEQKEEHNRLNRQLRAAEHFEGIAELASGIAHDINNLLTIISGSAELVAYLHPDDAELLAETDAILAAVDRGATLTRQVLAYSRRQALHPVVFDAAEEIESNRLMLVHAAGHAASLSVDVRLRPAPICADRTQFLTGLINLVANARDACGRDPRIEVRVAAAGPDDEADAAGPAWVMVEVADNGSGMTSAVAARAFDPFFTTKKRGEGTGLGLSMVHGFVHQSGGTLRLSSAPGAGTSVRLYFPSCGLHAAEPAGPPAEAGAREAAPSVLVVDDTEPVRRALGRLLELHGMRVAQAASAREAIGLLGQRQFDGLLSDVMMPGELDGLDLARWARGRGMPVVLVSGFVGGELPQDLLADPGVRLLRKPVDLASLARTVRQIVAAGGGPARPRG